MSKKLKKRVEKTEASIEELSELIRSLGGTSRQPANTMRIPGYDSYAPSYLSNGADAGVATDAELERHPNRDK